MTNVGRLIDTISKNTIDWYLIVLWIESTSCCYPYDNGCTEKLSIYEWCLISREGAARKTDIMRLDLSGRFAINVVNNIIVVHHQASRVIKNISLIRNEVMKIFIDTCCFALNYCYCMIKTFVQYLWKNDIFFIKRDIWYFHSN